VSPKIFHAIGHGCSFKFAMIDGELRFVFEQLGRWWWVSVGFS
jgi:hypothetical protein